MPLPPSPTRKPDSQANRLAFSQANEELLQKGILCALIGISVLVAPYFLRSANMRGIVAQAAPVGWLAVALGVGLIATYLRRRHAGRKV